jgi:uncharacterized phage protein (TIGR01671 family)
MNNEIKFRAWDRKRNHMAYQGEPDLETLQSFMFHYGDEDKILMRYTGFNDSKDKEVFEGDLLRVPQNVFHIEGIYEVIFNKCEFVGLSKLGNNRDLASKRSVSYLLEIKSYVIGNIYENQYLRSLNDLYNKE